MACTMATRLLGFVRNATIAALFGAGGAADVLNAVFTIPNSFRKLMAEGALSSAFIPVLSELIVKHGEDTTRRDHPAPRLVRNVITFQVWVLVPLLALAAVFPRGAMRLFAEFPDPERFALSAQLFRFEIHYLILVSVSAVFMGVLNSHNMFVIPALAPLVFSVCVISSLLLFHRTLGVFSMAVGVLAGGVLQAVVQLPRFLKLGYNLVLERGWRNPEFRRVLRLWVPVVVTSSIFAVNQLIAVRFASGLAVGSTSALSYAVVFWQLPFGVFSASVTTVLFPRMSRQAAAADNQGLIESVSYGLRFLLVLLVPAAVFYILLGRGIIGVAYQRGAFTAEATRLTAQVLTGYSVGLYSVGAFNFMQRFFYSVKDYRTPLRTAAVVVALDLGLSLWLKETPLGVIGLALANSISFSVGLGMLLVAARGRLGRLGGRKLAASGAKVLLALVLPTLTVLGFREVAGRVTPDLAGLGLLLGEFVIFSLLLVGGYWVLKVEVARHILQRRRIG